MNIEKTTTLAELGAWLREEKLTPSIVLEADGWWHCSLTMASGVTVRERGATITEAVRFAVATYEASTAFDAIRRGGGQ